MDFSKMGNDEPTRAFLSKSLGSEVVKVEVKPGTKPGEGYSTLHLAIRAELANGQVRHLFLKSFPEHPMRQNLLKKTNAFYKEYKIYCEIFPEFNQFQRDAFQDKIKLQLAIPTIVSADGIDYRDDINKEGDPVAGNYVLMVDMKKEHGFEKMHNFHRINLTEALKIVDELAKIHAVSWAIKKKYRLTTLDQRYPYWIENLLAEKSKPDFEHMLKKNNALFLEIIEEKLGSESDELKAAKEWLEKNDSWEVCRDLVNASGVNEAKVEGYLRKPWKAGAPKPIEDSWTVLTQTDLWINNMLFKFEKGELEKVLLLDFQYSRESCPTIELAFLLYICADRKFRRDHLTEILRFYHQRFTTLCTQLGVQVYPGFTMENLERRFHRSRLYAILSAIWFSPVLFTDPDKITDMEKVEAGRDNVEDMKEFVEAAFQNNQGWEGTPLKQIYQELAEEAYELGIF